MTINKLVKEAHENVVNHMSTTRYKIRLWEYDGEASVANAVTFDSFDEAQARFNDLRVSEEMPCVEFIKERIANGCIIADEVLNVRQFTENTKAIRSLRREEVANIRELKKRNNRRGLMPEEERRKNILDEAYQRCVDAGRDWTEDEMQKALEEGDIKK